MRAALYCRVSTTDQNNEVQLKELTAYCLARGWTVAEVHQDQSSGVDPKRKGLSAVLESARNRRVDVVIVWKIDRFGRSVKDLVNNVAELEANGVRFIAITQGIDTDQSNPVSRFLMTILAGVAELEREFIRERQKVGIENRRRKGLPMGRLPRIFRRDLAQEMHEAGSSIRQIAQKLGIPKSTVYAALSIRVPRELRKPASKSNGLGV